MEFISKYVIDLFQLADVISTRKILETKCPIVNLKLFSTKIPLTGTLTF